MNVITPEDLEMRSHPKSLINLLRGWPNPSLLPVNLLQPAVNRVLSDRTIADPGLLYGPDSGDPRLRECVAKWLTKFYKPAQPVSRERISITGGASQNLGCLLQVYSDPAYTRNVWMIAPAYMLAFRIFQDSGFHEKLRAVPEDEEGVDIQYLQKRIKKSEERAKAEGNLAPVGKYKPSRPYGKIYRHIIYAVPAFSNPSSKTMSLRRREQLVRVAREFDALIITDDVYDFLQWPSSTTTDKSALESATLPRIVDVDRTLDGGAEREGADGFGNVASNGSFSKIAGPGLRTGWVEGTKKFAYGVSQTGTTASGGAPSQLTSTYVAELLESGELQKYIFSTLQPAYAERYRIMLKAIEEHLLPLGVTLSQSDRQVVGGYFIWLSLPPNIRGKAVAQRAKAEENLIVAEGELFQVPGDEESASFPHDLRLCFAWESTENLREGVERLARVVSTMQREGQDGDAMAPATENGHTRQEDGNAW